MKKLAMLVAVAVITTLIGTSIAFSQETTLEDVKAEFGDLTRPEVEALGYAVDPVCVDAGELPPPVLDALNLTATAAMGFHAVNEDLFDASVDPLEPEVILLGPDDEVWGVEYEAIADTEDPTVVGQEMPLLEGGHPGMEFDHYAMHAWFIDNPDGQFADFNPAVSCPAAAEQVEAAPVTGTGGYLTNGGSSGTLAVLTLVAGIAGVTLVAGGWTVRRVTGR